MSPFGFDIEPSACSRRGNEAITITHRHFEAFRAVILSGGFSRAARQLGTSQPSISRLIAQLQLALGFRLFVRIKGNTEPTAEALELHAEVERSFTGLRALLERGADIRDQRVGRLRLATMPALAHSFLPGVIARFIAERPEMRVTLQVQRSEMIPAWIKTQQFDAAFAMLPAPGSGIEIDIFHHAEGVCVMPAGHPLARRRTIDIRDLRDVPFIASGPDGLMQGEIDRVAKNAGVSLRARIETPLSAIACRFAAEGAGVTIADPFTAAAFEGQGLAVRRLTPAIRFDFAVLYPAAAPRSNVLRQFIAAAGRERDALFQPARAWSRRRTR